MLKKSQGSILTFSAATFLCCVSSACARWGDGDLECAALIAAADGLVATKAVEPDEKISKMGLVVSMGYLNAYAVPKQISEQEAFAAVLAERDTLLKTQSPTAIVQRATACISRAQVKSPVAGH
jgi:hypothetical protein